MRAYLANDAAARVRFGERLQFVQRLLKSLGRRFGYPSTPEDVEDLSGNVFEVVLRKVSGMRDVPLEAWLHRVCNLQLSNALRRRQRARAALAPTDEVAAEDPAIRALASRELVFQALERLSPDDATAVRLRWFDGLTFPEIALQLGVTVNVVKGRHYRGIEQLRAILAASESE